MPGKPLLEKQVLYAHVALPLPLDKLFTYEVPAELADKVTVGVKVKVPLGSREVDGVVAALADKCELEKAKAVIEVYDLYLPPELLALCEFVSSYYGCSFGEAAQAVLPPGKSRRLLRLTAGMLMPGPEAQARVDELARAPRQKELLARVVSRGSVELSEAVEKWGFSRATIKSLIDRGFLTLERTWETSALEDLEPPMPVMNSEQSSALARVLAAVGAGGFHPFLLHGVTGSGKTEVYIKAAERVVAEGGGAIILVPEIGLIPQAVARYRRVFGRMLEVVHSRLSPGERCDIWFRLREGRSRLVIGPRSAVFSPVWNLKLIVVDEEQDPSYKQEEKPRYHARSVALMRGKMEGLTVLLGSATPSAESFHLAKEGRYGYLLLSSRPLGTPLPRVRVVDMRQERIEGTYFSHFLVEGMRAVLGRGRQCILFLNKRGHARMVSCPACGWVARCAHCDISLIYHRVGGRVRCHFCGYGRSLPSSCPQCGSPGFRFVGAGTQRIELELEGLFPGARVLRMDADTTSGKTGHRRVLEAFASGTYGILLGTQMVAKGHHFPGVDLVGVLNAEEQLFLPDFRAAERTFCRLVQVAGRAGRGGEGGEVVVQTYCPHHYLFEFLTRYDYDGFMEKELAVRKQLGYPPYGRLISAVITAANRKLLAEVAEGWVGVLRREVERRDLRVLGPAPPVVERLQGRYRQQVLLKGNLRQEDKKKALAAYGSLCTRLKGVRGVEMRWNVDPQSFF